MKHSGHKGPHSPRGTKSGSPVMPPPPPAGPEDVAAAVKNHQKDFDKRTFAKLGAKAIGTHPGLYQEVRVITSWVDVAPLLRDLYINNRDIRVTFPEPKTGKPNEKALTKVEQTQIRNFLRDNHDKSIHNIGKELVKKLEGSIEFMKFSIANNMVTADQWVEAHLTKVTTKDHLNITDVISIPKPEKALEVLKRADVLATLSDPKALSTNMGVIFETTSAEPKHLEALAGVLRGVEGLVSQRSPEVWVIRERDLDLTSKAKIGLDNGPSVSAYRLGDFLTKYPTPPGGDMPELGTAIQKYLEDATVNTRTLRERLADVSEQITALLAAPDEDQEIAKTKNDIRTKTAALKTLQSGAKTDQKKAEDDLEKLKKSLATLESSRKTAEAQRKQKLKELERLRKGLESDLDDSNLPPIPDLRSFSSQLSQNEDLILRRPGANTGDSKRVA